MVPYSDKNILVGLDIGTSKVAAVVGELNSSGELNIIGVGQAQSKGLKRGVVVNIDETYLAIQEAIGQVELMLGFEMHSVCTGIAGSHVRALNSHGIVAIRNQEVSEQDVERVLDAAKTMAIPPDQKILHVLPQSFTIDNQHDIRNPVGMSGVRLEAKVHIVTAAVSATENIVKCIRRCDLEVDDVVLEQLASSYATLTDDEKELGVCLVDIGAGTTDIIIFHEGAIRYTSVIPIAGDQITHDIAMALRTPTALAEQLKKQEGSVHSCFISENDMIETATAQDRQTKPLSRRLLAEVIEARFEELLGLVHDEIRCSGFEQFLAAGIVLTGGSAKIDGACELAERVFNMPVRLGSPSHVTGLSEVVNNPMYSTGVGLLLYAREYAQKRNQSTGWIGQARESIWRRVKSWF